MDRRCRARGAWAVRVLPGDRRGPGEQWLETVGAPGAQSGATARDRTAGWLSEERKDVWEWEVPVPKGLCAFLFLLLLLLLLLLQILNFFNFSQGTREPPVHWRTPQASLEWVEGNFLGRVPRSPIFLF